jgi:23S rRNA pseudouridine1911/1915/1917 synthase
LDVLFEDNHLLVLNKPAGLATMGVGEDEPSLVNEAKQYIKAKYQKPGNVYLGVVSRLDSLASGAVVLARTSKAAARLTELFRSRAVAKTYWAVTGGQIVPATGSLVDWVLKNETQQRMTVVEASRRGAQEARLSYRTLSQLRVGSLIEVDLETGRKHQIRLQLAERGFPIFGDRKYGSPVAFCHGRAIALHSRRLAFKHPVRHEELEFEVPPPQAWRELGFVGT